MIASLSVNSLKQYNVAYKKWWKFCQTNNNYDYLSVSVPLALNFLTNEFQLGASYATINTYRSALSLIFGKTFSENHNVSRFVKGVYKMRPCFPKYQTTWDTNVVLDYVSNWYPNEAIPLDKLTKKLVALLALSTAQRVQTLSLIRLTNVKVNQRLNIEITIDDIIKTSAPGKPMPRLIIPFFPNNIEICPAQTLLSYIETTSNSRLNPNTDRLILTAKKPCHNASASTISRWIKQVLSESGIDTHIYSAHSARHAATSAAGRRGISVEIIKKTAGWTGNSLIFGKFYNRPLSINQSVDNVFAESIYNNDIV